MIWYRPALEQVQRVHRGPPFEIGLWSGERIRIGESSGAARFVIHFKTRTALVRSLLQSSLGFGESYVRGDITIDGDLEDAIATLGATYLHLSPPGPVKRAIQRALARSLPEEKADVERMGFDDRFMRTWEFYLASVVAGFRSGHLNLIQMVMSNGINDAYPLTRDFLYTDEHRRPESAWPLDPPQPGMHAG